MSFGESDVEDAAIEWLKDLGYAYTPGPILAPDGASPERASYASVILKGRLRSALARINPHLPGDALDEVARTVLRLDSPAVEENNLAFHRLLAKGVEVQVSREDGVRGDIGCLVDFDSPDKNDWLVVNQFTVIDGKQNKRPDVIVFLNGLPVAVLELKNPQAEQATLASAWNQLQTYKNKIPALFNTNEVLVISDGSKARVGSLTAGFSRFGPWRTVDGAEPDAGQPELQVLLEGLFEKRRFLEYLKHFVIWETDDGYIKKIAGYHQFHAVRRAVQATVAASRPDGDRRIGVVWHTQGSGKSVSMAFFAGKIIVEPAMENPTLVIVTDRNDLDDQLFGQFCAAKDLIPLPEQAESREHLRELLSVPSGGVIFTTMQKFGLSPEEMTLGKSFPVLSDRRNIVVIADEAHRTQYQFGRHVDSATGRVSVGLARNLRDALPRASFIGFTGTPIEAEDRSTREVFGEDVHTYTMSEAVEDGAVVPIHYEARLAKIGLKDDDLPSIDEEFEEVTEGEEETARHKLKTKWARLEAMVGTRKRLALLADDIIAHYERRCEMLPGKAMIVCMSRRICVDLYRQIVKKRPEWHSDDDKEGRIKVVMTGSSSDPQKFQPHIRSKAGRKAIEKRFKADKPDAKGETKPLDLVIVRDMWLTGFDVPAAHTLYLDKPIRGHNLMQAIARVNRVFKDKPAGLVVDYLGLAEQLRKAVERYGGEDEDANAGGDVARLALPVFVEKFQVVKDMFHGHDYTGFFSDKPTERVTALTTSANFICGLPDNGKDRFLKAMTELNKAAALCLHLEEAQPHRDELSFFQTVQRNIAKYTVTGSGENPEHLDAAIRQIVSSAITSDGVIDIFDKAGIERPDISILSDEFLASVQASPNRNLQIELLRKLLNDAIKTHQRRNVVQSRRFSELLQRTILKYQNRTLEAAEVILELIKLAEDLRDAPKRGDALGLSEDELAFYDALAAHGGVREVMGDEVLSKIAHDLVEAIRASVTVDWTQKESVRARMRSKVKWLLRKHRYPPDKRQAAVDTVIEQAEHVCRDWANAA